MKPKLLTTLRGYTAAQFSADLFAGVTVAMVVGARVTACG